MKMTMKKMMMMMMIASTHLLPVIEHQLTLSFKDISLLIRQLVVWLESSKLGRH